MKIFLLLLFALSTTNTTPFSFKAPPMKTSPTPFNLDEEETTQCEHGSITYNNCNDECECQNGKLINCYRVRQEFTQMGFADRRRYIEAYKQASVDPSLVVDFSKLVGTHIFMPHQLLHHSPIIFLPWHRWYLMKWENLLRKIDCRITLPFWDWSRMATNWSRNTDPSDVWNSGDHGFGGNGVPPDDCVEDGPFGKDAWNLTEMGGGGCLTRKFNYSMSVPNRKEVKDNLSYNVSDFLKFEEFIRYGAHAALHGAVSGTMLSNNASSNAPETILHHGFLDKIWATWQNKGADYKLTFFTETKFKLPFSSTYGWQWLDNDNLPEGIKIRYEDIRDGMENAM